MRLDGVNVESKYADELKIDKLLRQKGLYKREEDCQG